MKFGKRFFMYGTPVSDQQLRKMRDFSAYPFYNPWPLNVGEIQTDPPPGTLMFRFRVTEEFMEDIEITARYHQISPEGLGRWALREFMRQNPAP